MSTLSVVIIVVIASIISGFLSWGIAEKKKWTLITSAVIIGSVISYLGTINLYMHNQFNKIENLVGSYNNELSKAQNVIESLDKRNNKLTKRIFKDELNNLEYILDKISSQNEIIVEKNEILNIWTKLITNSKQSFYASNLVPPSEWQYVTSDDYGIKPQKEAISRGVDVKRINFFDEDSEIHKEGIELVYKNQSDNGIPSQKTSLKSVEDNFTFNSLIEELRTADVVLVDNEILLLTMVNKDYEMQFAVLSFDDTKISAAQKFFTKIFENFKPVKNE